MFVFGKRQVWELIKMNWGSLLAIVAVAVILPRELLCTHRSHPMLSQEAGYQAAFKWSAMLSLRQADTNCDKPTILPEEITCIVKERVSPEEIRAFRLSCSTKINENNGCRLIARLPP